MIKVVILGTGNSTGIPLIGCQCAVCMSEDKRDKRLRSSVFIETENTHILIDTSADFRYQMIKHKIRRLDAILYTHFHKDHIGGIDDLRAFNFIQKERMKMYANELTLKTIKKDYAYNFSENKAENTLDADLFLVDPQTPFSVKDVNIIPISVWHSDIEILGFRVGDFTYITDASKLEEKEIQKIVGSKVLVINALRKEKHHGHFTLNEAIDFAQKLKIPQTYFTHISHQMGLTKDVMKELPENISLAYDGLSIEV